MTTLTSARRSSGLSLLRYGFRPFFFGAGVWALLAMVLRVGDIGFASADGLLFQDPTRWHAHAFVFGYASAVVAGFALTAVPNWTGRLPITGGPLFALWTLWIAGRAAALLPLPAALAAAVDIAFLPVLAGVLTREVVAGKNKRNIPVCALIALFGAANLIFHLESLAVLPTEGHGTRAGLAMLVLLIGVIGGRIVPSFTNNWLARHGAPRVTANAWLDRAGHCAGGIAAAAWIAAPYADVTGTAFVVAAAIHVVRLAAWRGWRTGREPLVLILHVAYAWIPLGFLLLGLGIWFDAAAMTAGLHALGAGAIGTMTLAVMTRATLGHTGRALHAGAATVCLNTAVTASAVLRVAAPFVAELYVPLLVAAGMFWIAAFALFVAVYGPMQWSPRVGDTA